MSESASATQHGSLAAQGGYLAARTPQSSNLTDVLERVLDKGIVIVGDIQVRLLDIELLTVKIRLMVASVERAREMGINWWEGDPFVSTRDGSNGSDRAVEDQADRRGIEGTGGTTRKGS